MGLSAGRHGGSKVPPSQKEHGFSGLGTIVALTPGALPCSVERVCSGDFYAIFH